MLGDRTAASVVFKRLEIRGNTDVSKQKEDPVKRSEGEENKTCIIFLRLIHINEHLHSEKPQNMTTLLDFESIKL